MAESVADGQIFRRMFSACRHEEKRDECLLYKLQQRHLSALLAKAPFASSSTGAKIRISRRYTTTRHSEARRMFLCADLHNQQCTSCVLEAKTAIETGQRLFK
eukprot:TRINITY_DN31196_c0_g1_i1.p3 TRINITY_DN31196_c0_g1~~TRINITY_DN31196_c0_g1_i1.p3  ORF type:complete len:103 (-),score=5.62 TRINITY_DN31196_c0_g1_i1:654-962(-)